MQEEWFKDWFNSPYYHILYKNRDTVEAATFIDKLSGHLKLSSEDIIWDLACGRGRHALYLNSKGYNVIGTDLSQNSIEAASKDSNERLEFFVHDMRTLFRINYFTHVFNLFTSIGYFDNVNDNAKVFKNVYLSLRPGGIFVVDFFNTQKVRGQLKNCEQKNVEGINFTISKKEEDKHIVKQIEFDDKDRHYCFAEKVSMLSKRDLEDFAAKAGFTLRETFGNYNLDAFNENSSDRLILIFKK